MTLLSFDQSKLLLIGGNCHELGGKNDQERFGVVASTDFKRV
jgi:hypothetical protein